MSPQSLKAKFTLIFTAAALITTLLGGYVFYLLSPERNNADFVNAAGRQRMLSQAMAKAVLSHLHTKDESALEAKSNLAEYHTALAVFTQTLSAFKSGGRYPANLKLTTFKTHPGNQEPDSQQTILQIETALKRFTETANQLISSNSTHKADSVHNLVSTANQLRKLSDDLTRQFAALSTSMQANARQTIGLIGLLIIAFFVGLFMLTNNRLLRPIRGMVTAANQIAKGELNHKIENHRTDEIGELYSALNQMVDNLNQMISKISQNSNQLVSASSDIHQLNQTMTDGSTQQLNLIEAATTQSATIQNAAENIAGSTLKIVDKVQHASDVTRNASSVARNGIDGMDRISNTVTTSAEGVERLATHSSKISDSISLIDEIANQTNLLALNAAIEAARAGEHGRGFAVVADEVRNLANRTTEATQAIEEMINSVQHETDAVTVSMKQCQSEVTTGSELISQLGTSLQDITNMVDTLKTETQQVASSAKQQGTTITEVCGGMKEVSNVAHLTSSQTEKSSQSSTSVTQLAHDLQSMIKDFKI